MLNAKCEKHKSPPVKSRGLFCLQKKEKLKECSYLDVACLFFYLCEKGVSMKQLISVLLGSAICAALASCAFSSSWHKSGVSEFDTESALAQCEYEAGKEHVDRADFVTNCMKRQGFRQ